VGRAGAANQLPNSVDVGIGVNHSLIPRLSEMAPANAINVRRVYQFLETPDHGGIIQPPEGAAVARADVATPGDAGTGGGPSAGPTHPRTFPARTLPATGNGANVDT